MTSVNKSQLTFKGPLRPSTPKAEEGVALTETLLKGSAGAWQRVFPEHGMFCCQSGAIYLHVPNAARTQAEQAARCRRESALLGQG